MESIVGQGDLPPAAARAILGPHAIIGLSITQEQEIGTFDPAVIRLRRPRSDLFHRHQV